jgi:hypothetical protein
MIELFLITIFQAFLHVSVISGYYFRIEGKLRKIKDLTCVITSVTLVSLIGR